MKIKIINSRGLRIEGFESIINNFIKNKKIIDIKYDNYVALIMYEE